MSEYNERYLSILMITLQVWILNDILILQKNYFHDLKIIDKYGEEKYCPLSIYFFLNNSKGLSVPLRLECLF